MQDASTLRIVRHRFASVCFLACAACCHAQQLFWGQAVEGFELAVGFEAESFQAGSPIEAIVVIRNAGESPRCYIRNSRWEESDFYFTIVRDRGEQIQRRSFGPQPASLAPTLLDPHGTITNRVRVTMFYDLSKPGTYVVTASRGVPSISQSTNRYAWSTFHVESGSAIIRVVNDTDTSATDGGASPSRAAVHPGPSPGVAILDNKPFRSAPTRQAAATTETPLAPVTATAAVRKSGYRRAQKGALILVAALVGLLLFVLWRASRRKTNLPRA